MNIKNLARFSDGDVDIQDDIELIELKDTPEDAPDLKNADSDSDIEEIMPDKTPVIIPVTMRSIADGGSETNDIQAMTPPCSPTPIESIPSSPTRT